LLLDADGVGQVAVQYIVEIARFLGVSPGYLLNGEKELTKEENELLRLFRILDEPKRKRLLQTAAEMCEKIYETYASECDRA